MIIPVRCFTCHKVIGNKWEYYKKKIDQHEIDTKKEIKLKDLEIDDRKKIFFSDDYKGKILDDIGLHKICCRRHMLGHVDLIDMI